MSWVLGSCALIISTSFGWKRYFLHLKRERVLCDVQGFLRFCMSEVVNYKTEFKKIAQKYQYKALELESALKNVEPNRLARLLKGAELTDYNEIFTAFVGLDARDLVIRLKSLENAFNEHLLSERNVGQKEGKLSLKMGVLIGLGAMIMLI